MAVNRFFWPQVLLDQWIDEEKISLEDNVLTIRSENRAYRANQAVFFEADVGDGQDAHGLLGRVKEMSTLVEMGAEHYMDSVILGDSAYKVVLGFTGEPMPGAGAVRVDGPHDLSGALSAQTGDDENEADDKELLARFLLENL